MRGGAHHCAHRRNARSSISSGEGGKGVRSPVHLLRVGYKYHGTPEIRITIGALTMGALGDPVIFVPRGKNIMGACMSSDSHQSSRTF